MSEPASSYGDVTAEYLAVREGAALVEPTHDLVWVEGADAVSFLESLLSQEVESAAPGSVARSLLLEPRGKLRATLWVLRAETSVGLLADRGLGSRVVEDLTRFRFRVDAAMRIDERPTFEVWGPEASAVLQRAGLAAPSSGWAADDGYVVAAIPLLGLPRYFVAGVHRDGLVGCGALAAGSLAVRAVRVEGGEPVMDRDIDDRTIPQEAGLVADAVSFTKGCYLGQELVARIDSRGRVNRHLRGIAVHTNVLPPDGALLLVGDREVGALTSVAESLTLRAPIGLALVRREVEPGDQVEVRWDGGSTTAEVRAIPLDDLTLE